MGVQIPHGNGNFEEGRAAYCKVYGHSAVSCAKMAEPIEMPFGFRTGVGPRKHVLGWVHAGATWQIPLNRPCVAAMQPFCQITLTACSLKATRCSERVKTTDFRCR